VGGEKTLTFNSQQKEKQPARSGVQEFKGNSEGTSLGRGGHPSSRNAIWSKAGTEGSKGGVMHRVMTADCRHKPNMFTKLSKNNERNESQGGKCGIDKRKEVSETRKTSRHKPPPADFSRIGAPDEWSRNKEETPEK